MPQRKIFLENIGNAVELYGKAHLEKKLRLKYN